MSVIKGTDPQFPKNGQPPDFDESKDRAYADWKRVRFAIEHENNLMNQRLTWLFTSQAFLFSAFALILAAFLKGDIEPDLAPYISLMLAVLATTGGYICLPVAVLLIAAVRQLRTLTTWWDSVCQDKSKHPKLHDFVERKMLSFLNAENVPFAFFFAWVLLLLLSLLAIIPKVRDLVGTNIPTLLLIIGTVLTTLVITIFARKAIQEVHPKG